VNHIVDKIFWYEQNSLVILIPHMHEKNGFVEVSKNIVRYRSENNFVGPIKIIKIIM